MQVQNNKQVCPRCVVVVQGADMSHQPAGGCRGAAHFRESRNLSRKQTILADCSGLFKFLGQMTKKLVFFHSSLPCSAFLPGHEIHLAARTLQKGLAGRSITQLVSFLDDQYLSTVIPAGSTTQLNYLEVISTELRLQPKRPNVSCFCRKKHLLRVQMALSCSKPDLWTYMIYVQIIDCRTAYAGFFGY